MNKQSNEYWGYFNEVMERFSKDVGFETLDDYLNALQYDYEIENEFIYR